MLAPIILITPVFAIAFPLFVTNVLEEVLARANAVVDILFKMLAAFEEATVLSFVDTKDVLIKFAVSILEKLEGLLTSRISNQPLASLQRIEALAPEVPLKTLKLLFKPTELPALIVNVFVLYTVVPLITKFPPTANWPPTDAPLVTLKVSVVVLVPTINEPTVAP